MKIQRNEEHFHLAVPSCTVFVSPFRFAVPFLRFRVPGLRFVMVRISAETEPFSCTQEVVALPPLAYKTTVPFELKSSPQRTAARAPGNGETKPKNGVYPEERYCPSPSSASQSRPYVEPDSNPEPSSHAAKGSSLPLPPRGDRDRW